MGFRITTNMMMNSYRYNLQNSTGKLADARDQVLTHRKFNSYAENPAAATQAFRLRRDYYQTSNQLTNTKEVYSKFNTAWHNLQGMLKDLINPMEKVSAIQGNNGTAGESRQALAQVLRETSESMIQGFNQQLGDHFIFAGNDGLRAPFEWKGDKLLYRGIDVNSGGMDKPTAPEPTWLEDVKTAAGAAWSEDDQAWYDYYTHATDVKPDPAENPEPTWLVDESGKDTTTPQAQKDGWLAYYNHLTEDKPTADEPAWAGGDPDEYGIPEGMPIVSDDPVEQGWIDYYNDKADYAKLKEMAGEEMYIDLGMGAKETGPNSPIRGTYFNSALSGLNFTDYGIDADGDPKNFAMLMQELADVFDGWRESGQKYLPEQYRDMDADTLKNLMESDKNVASQIEKYHAEMEEKSFRLMDKLKKAQETLTAAHVEMDAQSSYLQTNQERLETQATDINAEILDVEQVDLADAITTLSWDMYCYNAALKIGNQLLSQSLIDYMT